MTLYIIIILIAQFWLHSSRDECETDAISGNCQRYSYVAILLPGQYSNKAIQTKLTVYRHPASKIQFLKKIFKVQCKAQF